MTQDKLKKLRIERDELVEDYVAVHSGRLNLSELQRIALGDRIEKLNKVIARLESDDAQGT